MRKALFSLLLRSSLAVLVLAMVLDSAAWAKPKFKMLRGVPGGLFQGVTFDAKGNLYSVTNGGGDYNHGTIFQLTPGAHGWSLTTLHSFNGQDGGTPNGGLIFDAAGNMYGTSPSGGIYNGGNVFEMSPGSRGWTFQDLYDFCQVYHCPDGGSPTPVVLDSKGRLYGAVAAGGVYGRGGVFRLLPGAGNWTESVIYSFGKRPYDAFIPYAAPIFDKASNLYGTTNFGGTNGVGTVFRLERAAGGGWKERLLYDFCSAGFPLCKDGMRPYAGVIFDAAGNLYGTTTQGGGNKCGETTCGTVFRLAPTQGGGSWKHKVLYAFPKPENGSFPTGGVILDKAGNLYGATVAGGTGRCSAGGCGVVYKLAPEKNGKWTYTVLHKFTGADGGQPLGGLTLDRAGNLYGTAYSEVFEITP